MVAQRNADVRALDPDHVTNSVLYEYTALGQYANTSALLGTDPYPWFNANQTTNLTTEVVETNSTVQLYGRLPGADKQHASLCVSQLFSWADASTKHNDSTEPPLEVKRAMAYMQPVMGCGGYLSYAYYLQVKSEYVFHLAFHLCEASTLFRTPPQVLS
jgi:hypothetical protein